MAHDRRAERRATLTLAAPLVVAFAGNQLLSLVDTLVAGRLGRSRSPRSAWGVPSSSWRRCFRSGC
ncbi:MAG: hypothetical protein R3F43_31250 [bacterium]